MLNSSLIVPGELVALVFVMWVASVAVLWHQFKDRRARTALVLVVLTTFVIYVPYDLCSASNLEWWMWWALSCFLR